MEGLFIDRGSVTRMDTVACWSLMLQSHLGDTQSIMLEAAGPRHITMAAQRILDAS